MVAGGHGKGTGSVDLLFLFVARKRKIGIGVTSPLKIGVYHLLVVTPSVAT